ncbi:hypothetical protein BGZ65_006169, partial [Modicella reniformis]
MGTGAGVQALFKDDETLMDEDLDYQITQMDDSVGPESNSYRSQLDPANQQFLGQQNFQPLPMFMPDKASSAAMSCASSFMDVNTESSRSSGSGSSSKSMTPTGQGMEDGLQSRTSSQDLDDVRSAVASAVSNQYPPTSEALRMNVFSVGSLSLRQPLGPQQQQQLESVSELSYSSDTGDAGEDPAIKRAEQNRAAQRAFRQRKQQYIKWLESKAEELDEVYRVMGLVRTENQQLRKLVMELDANLNDSQKEITTSTSSMNGVSGPKIDEVDVGRGKGKSTFKLNQIREQQHQMLMLQNQQAIQLQEQYRQREQQRQQQRSMVVPATTGTDSGANAIVMTSPPASDIITMSSGSRLSLQPAYS